MDHYSSVCAVQNLWLAARAEGLGVGWVSIIKQEALQKALNIPANIVPIAYLCIGHVTHFHQSPELQKAGWRNSLPLEDLIHFDQWQQPAASENDNMIEEINQGLSFPERFID